MPNVMAVEGGTLERWLGNKDGALMHEISALIKEAPGSSLTLSTKTRSQLSAT